MFAKIRGTVAHLRSHMFAVHGSCMDRPLQKPEGRLIKDRLKQKGIAVRELDRRTAISEGRIRQIINGYASAGRGQYVDVVAPAATLAELAHALGIAAEDLAEVGRSDAAEVLLQRPEATELLADPFGPDSGLTDEGGAAWDDPAAGEVMSTRTVRDEKGRRMVKGVSVKTDRDDVRSRIEVRFWPGAERRISHVDFISVLGDAHRGALKALSRDELEDSDVDMDITTERPSVVLPINRTGYGPDAPGEAEPKAARSAKSLGRQLREDQDKDAEASQD